MTVTTSLLREWNWLQAVIFPLLSAAPPRSPQAWTIGHTHDAVALALAYSHVLEHGDDVSVFLSPGPGGPDPVQFSLADIRCLPRESRQAAFLRENRRYVPNDNLMNRVILSAPAEPVDLLSIRLRDRSATAPPTVRSAMARLRRGGHLLWPEPPPPGLVAGPDFEPVDRSQRLFVKTTDPVAAPLEAEADGRAASPATLASRVEQARLVESHYNLARSLARRFAHHGELADDLEQVALLALVKAAGRFSSDHGSSFATFATASILGELKRHFRDKTWMLRVPRSLQETYLSVKAARDELGQTLGASPTVQQIAAHLRISEEVVLSAMEAGDSYWPASLDTPRRGEEESVTDIPVVDGKFESTLDRRQLRESLPQLEQRERLIIKRLYFDGWTQRRVAEEIGVSQMQVSRLMARTLAKLRVSFGEV